MKDKSGMLFRPPTDQGYKDGLIMMVVSENDNTLIATLWPGGELSHQYTFPHKELENTKFFNDPTKHHD